MGFKKDFLIEKYIDERENTMLTNLLGNKQYVVD